MAIRPITESDRQDYIDLYEAVAAEGRWIGGELPVDHADLSARVDRALTLDNVKVFVATDDEDQTIGHLGLVEVGGIVDFGMWLTAESRGRGIGGQMLAAGVDWSRSRGAHKMTLEVWPHNERAIALYQRTGFEVEGRLIRHYRRNDGELWDCLIMGLALDAKS